MKYTPIDELDIELLKEQLPEPTQVDPKPTQKIDYLTILCSGIEAYEGWFPQSRSFRNNSPGNVRYSSVGYLPKYGVVKRDPQNFAIFSSYEIGWLYLKNLIIHKATMHPDWNLLALFKEYAPTSDGNNPTNYSNWVAKRMKVDPLTFQLNQLYG